MDYQNDIMAISMKLPFCSNVIFLAMQQIKKQDLKLAIDSCIYLFDILVGAIGFEPTTPTMSR